ncbi:hypothetical protein [Bosea sp. BK604]|uniref:hypothetical protein n=1 Tax=Bosea sp. BK604 TaxID=2512180 RepID=UPI0020BE2532|nr:hypothetical protein [Bosea sp. BK604]
MMMIADLVERVTDDLQEDIVGFKDLSGEIEFDDCTGASYRDSFIHRSRRL